MSRQLTGRWALSLAREQGKYRSVGRRAVEASHPVYQVTFVNCCVFEMGCTRSKINPDICEKDEDEWMKKTMQHCSIISSCNPETHNNNIGLFNVDSTMSNMNTNMIKCECGWDWRSELPELLLLALVVVCL